MSLLCILFGHRYNTNNIAEEAQCTKCGHIRPAVVWPRPPESIFPEIKEYPPMPKCKPPRPVIVEDVTCHLSGRAIAMAQLESERETLNRLILESLRKIDQEKSRLNELYGRRDFTANAMHALIEQN